MSRTLWFVAGAATSAYALTKARRAAEAFTPEGVRDRLAGLSLGAQLFGDEVRAEAAAKEADLRERLGLVPDATPALSSASDPAANDPATSDPAASDPAVNDPAANGATHPRPLHLTREGNT